LPLQLHCNGRIIGDTLIKQSWSQYDKALYTQELISHLPLHAGQNTLGRSLGNSFWRVDAANDGGRYTKTDDMPDFAKGQRVPPLADATIETAPETHITSDGN